MAARKSTASKAVTTERARLLRQIGRRIRWLREAWEQLQPGRHAQTQWAQAFSISPMMMSRIECGRQLAPIDVLLKIITFSGASADYVLLGVASEQAMLAWLYQSLMTAHGGDLMTFERYQESLQLRFGTTPSRHARKSGRLRRQYQLRRNTG